MWDADDLGPPAGAALAKDGKQATTALPGAFLPSKRVQAGVSPTQEIDNRVVSRINSVYSASCFGKRGFNSQEWEDAATAGRLRPTARPDAAGRSDFHFVAAGAIDALSKLGQLPAEFSLQLPEAQIRTPGPISNQGGRRRNQLLPWDEMETGRLLVALRTAACFPFPAAP